MSALAWFKGRLGIDRHRAHEEPRLKLIEEPGDKIECMFCGREGHRPIEDPFTGLFAFNPDRMCEVQGGLYGKLYFHAACGTGRSGRQIEVAYYATHTSIFGGHRPLMFD